MVDHLWEHIDTVFTSTRTVLPAYVRKVISDLVVLHCLYSCDRRPHTSALMAACQDPKQSVKSWRDSAPYAFAAASASEFSFVEKEIDRTRLRDQGRISS